MIPASQVSGYFPRSYRESRQRLITSASAFRSQLGVLIDTRAIGERGPEGESLALDWVQFGARRPRVALVLSSATHGVEGFLGSALQHATIQRLLTRLRLQPDTAIIIQHANNPFGFAWLRRVNESNVDLNRNFCATFNPPYCSDDYETLFDALNPTDLDADNEALRRAAIVRFVDEHGEHRFQQVVSEGQYKHPHGMQYGGQRHEAATTALLELTGEHLADAEQVAWLDIHTGLGESGACELISGAGADSDALKTARGFWGEGVRSAASGESISTPPNGVLDRGIASVLAPTTRVGMVYAEYGTHPLARVFSAMRADNWLHQHGDPSNPADSLTRAIKAEILEAFRPDDEGWRKTVIDHGLALMHQALSRLPGVRQG